MTGFLSYKILMKFQQNYCAHKYIFLVILLLNSPYAYSAIDWSNVAYKTAIGSAIVITCSLLREPAYVIGSEVAIMLFEYQYPNFKRERIKRQIVFQKKKLNSIQKRKQKTLPESALYAQCVAAEKKCSEHIDKLRLEKNELSYDVVYTQEKIESLIDELCPFVQ
jgi:hypothetical protein